MAMDTPATIAILGAGPIGLETALYARFLGYDVRVYERGRIADNVRRWGHVRMFSPFALNCSPLGQAALLAQDDHYRTPEAEDCPTGNEWIARYLLPLAQTDLVADHIHENSQVLGVSRWDAGKGDLIGQPERGEGPFRLLIRDARGGERTDSADIVIDATGVFGLPNWLGPGGTPAIGELGLRSRIEYGLPDIQSSLREKYAGHRTLLVGSGYSAATSAVAIAEVAEQSPGTHLLWITRAARAGQGGPIRRIEQDRLPRRDALAARANSLVESHPAVEHLAGWHVLSIAECGNRFEVLLARPGETWDESEQRTELVDQIVANVGYRPDSSLHAELQVHQCYASDGPIKLAAALLKQASPDCLAHRVSGAEMLMNPEPNFYLLGAKSYGRNSQFLFLTGLQQIRDLFAVIGDRADLDLYKTAQSLPR